MKYYFIGGLDYNSNLCFCQSLTSYDHFLKSDLRLCYFMAASEEYFDMNLLAQQGSISRTP